MVRQRKPPSQTWRTFLITKDLVCADFFVAPTVFFKVLFVFVILSHDRPRPAYVAVSAHPTAEWTARQRLETFPWDSAPRDLLRDRDGIVRASSKESSKNSDSHEIIGPLLM